MSSALHRCDGSVCEEPFWDDSHEVLARGTADPSDLRETVHQTAEERCDGRGCDHKPLCAPNLHYVEVKSAEHQASVAFRTDQSLVGQRTQLINALRGHLAEFGLVVARGPPGFKAVAGMIDNDATELPETVRDIARLYLDQIAVLTYKIDELHFKLRAATKVDEGMLRLCTVPGVGPVTAGAIIAFATDLRTFASGTNFAAWLGLVPRQRSTGGKTRLGGVRKWAGRYSQIANHWRDEQNPLDHPARHLA